MQEAGTMFTHIDRVRPDFRITRQTSKHAVFILFPGKKSAPSLKSLENGGRSLAFPPSARRYFNFLLHAQLCELR